MPDPRVFMSVAHNMGGGGGGVAEQTRENGAMGTEAAESVTENSRPARSVVGTPAHTTTRRQRGRVGPATGGSAKDGLPPKMGRCQTEGTSQHGDVLPGGLQLSRARAKKSWPVVYVLAIAFHFTVSAQKNCTKNIKK